jgi:hypothetical protein
MQSIDFTERLTIAAPADFRDAVRAAARRQGLTIADYTRSALSARMKGDGVSFPSLPCLSARAGDAE